MHICTVTSHTSSQTIIIESQFVRVCVRVSIAESKLYVSGKVYHSPCLPLIAIEFNTVLLFFLSDRDFFPSQRRILGIQAIERSICAVHGVRCVERLENSTEY